MFKKIINFIKNLLSSEKSIYGNGLIPSPTDFRDIPLGAVSTMETPTPVVYHIPYILTVKDQGNKPHCVGYVCATIKEYLERKEGNIIEFDGDWLYRECKKIDGIPNASGTYFRTGLSVLKNIGCKPLNGKEEDAGKYRIGGYARVDCDFDSLKRAIYEFGAILMGFKGSNQGWQTALIRPPKAGESGWGHATAGVGLEEISVYGQNSWGKNWGNKGLFRFLKEYRPFEAWSVISDFPSNWRELLNLDEPKTKYSFNNNLFIGLKNEEVKILQTILKEVGCMKKTQESTGYFGNITKTAIIAYQQRKGLSQTGYFGPLTRASLNKEIST